MHRPRSCATARNVFCDKRLMQMSQTGSSGMLDSRMLVVAGRWSAMVITQIARWSPAKPDRGRSSGVAERVYFSPEATTSAGASNAFLAQAAKETSVTVEVMICIPPTFSSYFTGIISPSKFLKSSIVVVITIGP